MAAYWRRAVLLFASTLLTACGGGSGNTGGPPTPAPVPVPPGMIGTAGGTVTGPSSAQVVVPAGALTQNTAIAIAQSSTGAPPLPGGVVAYGPIFAFTPHGTSFQSAVTITVPFDPAAVPAGTTPLLYKTNAAMNGWDAVAAATISGSTMSASITSFSYLAVASPPPPPPPPPPVLSNVKRYWSFDRHYIGGVVSNFGRGHLSGSHVLDEADPSGDLLYAPDDVRDPEKRTSYARVHSNETGNTYWASSVAPHARIANELAIGSTATLDQYQYWIKTAEDATLQYKVTEVWLEAASANVIDPEECDPAAGFRPLWCRMADYASVALSFIAINTVTQKTFLDAGMAVDLVGWQGSWDFGVQNILGLPLIRLPQGGLDAAFDFNQDVHLDGGLHSIVRLRQAPLRILIPLDKVKVGETFKVHVTLDAITYNLMQGESYYSAYLRDPVETDGVEFLATGLDPVAPPDGDEVDPPREELPECTSGPDPAAGTLQFDAPDFKALEKARAPVFVSRSGGSVGDVSVNLSTADGTASDGADYSAVDGAIIFADGEEGRRVVTIPMQSDTAIEGNETIELTLSNVRGCASLGDQTSATMTIIDDDTTPATFTIGGTVSGLVGSGLVLSASASSINASNGPFTMPTPLRDGAAYDLRVTQQPSNPLQVCSVTRGTGTIHNANVTDIAVDCVTPLPNGALDPTFGGSGKVANNTLRPAVAIARQTDGKLVILSEQSRLSRYNADGTQDLGFGTNGVAIATFNNASDIARGLALQSDGKIVVVGRAFGGTLEDFGVARFNANGTLDTDFATNGKLLIDINGSFDEAIVPLLQPDGSIVIAGTGGTSGPLGVDSDFTAVRLTSDGDLDSGFGTGGKVRTNIAGRADLVTSALLQPDGKILVAGRVGVDGGALPDTGLVRYTSTGALDLGDFGHGTGIARIDLSASGHDHDAPSGLALTSDGKIVLAVEAAQTGIFQHTLARLDTHGILDDSFGSHGVARNSFAAGGDFARELAIQTDGRIVTAGSTRPTDSFSDDMLITRHDANGALDATFGSSGKVIVDFFSSADGVAALLIQPDGKIVAAGVGRNANTNSLAIVRVLP